jgi:hypothetical protein
MAEKKVSSYRDLEIWKMARELAVGVHKMTLEKLPKFEFSMKNYEPASGIQHPASGIQHLASHDL